MFPAKVFGVQDTMQHNSKHVYTDLLPTKTSRVLTILNSYETQGDWAFIS